MEQFEEVEQAGTQLEQIEIRKLDRLETTRPCEDNTN